MSHDASCVRCGGHVHVSDDASTAVDASPAALRRQGWVASTVGPIHLGCLGWAEVDALFGGAAPESTPPARTGRFRRTERVADAPAVR